jgi:MFS family permease
MTDARRARRAVTAIFLLNGLLFGSWAARIPAIRDRLALSDGELGLALAFLPIGAIIAMPLAGALAARAGSRRATRLAFALACATIGVVALAPSFAAFAALAFTVGIGMGMLDVSMNVHGVTVERRYGRPILSSFHAAFSLGGLAGAALGALAAGAGLDVRVHLALAAGVCGAVGLAWSRRFLPGSADATPAQDPVFVRPPRRLWALGALAFACLLIEGASADWSGVYIKDELGTGPGLAALGFTAFSVTMTLGRIFGDRLVTRFGSARLVRAGGFLAALGFGCALVASSPAAALVGFACLGAGMSSVIPIVFRTAGQVPGIASSVALSAVSSVGYLGFVAGPPAIGGIAELVGLPGALGVLVVLAAAVAVLASTTDPRAAAPASAEADAGEPEAVAA